jgi:alpha-galactosidase
MTFTATGLPKGLTMNERGIFEGVIAAEGSYIVRVRAENAMGVDEMDITFAIAPDHVLRTPLLGFTSWNAFRMDVTQEDMLRTARIMDESGLCEYGFAYVNTDSSWQDRHNEALGYVTPNEKFPDMKAMCDEIHARGLKAGIYSTPFLSAWGTPDPTIDTGCTTGQPDYRWPTVNNRGFGINRHEKANVQFWCDCGFDYLKYDFAPGDPYNADLMKQELVPKTPVMHYAMARQPKGEE